MKIGKQNPKLAHFTLLSYEIGQVIKIDQDQYKVVKIEKLDPKVSRITVAKVSIQDLKHEEWYNTKSKFAPQ